MLYELGRVENNNHSYSSSQTEKKKGKTRNDEKLEVPHKLFQKNQRPTLCLG